MSWGSPKCEDNWCVQLMLLTMEWNVCFFWKGWRRLNGSFAGHARGWWRVFRFLKTLWNGFLGYFSFAAIVLIIWMMWVCQSDKHDSEAENNALQPPQNAREHVKQLQRLEGKVRPWILFFCFSNAYACAWHRLFFGRHFYVILSSFCSYRTQNSISS